MPDAAAILHAGRRVARNSSSSGPSRSNSNGSYSGAAAPSASTAAAGSAAEIMSELRALREAMSAGAGAFMGQVRASRPVSRVSSRGPSREPAAGDRSSRGASREPVPSGHRVGVRRSLSPAPFVPSSSVPGSLDGLSRELRRTTDAYFALLRSAKAERDAASRREEVLQDDLARARAAATSRARKHNEIGIGPVGISEGDAHNAPLKAASEQSEVPTSALDDTRSRVAALSARVFAAEDRAAALSREREALLDFVQVRFIPLLVIVMQQMHLSHTTPPPSYLPQELQKKLQASANASASALSINEALAASEAVSRESSATVNALRDTVRALAARAADGQAEVETLRAGAARAAELEAAGRELAATVKVQADELQKSRALMASAANEAKRLARAERSLAAYERVETALASRTGQRFFGEGGLARELGVDIAPDQTELSAAAARAMARSEGRSVATSSSTGSAQDSQAPVTASATAADGYMSRIIAAVRDEARAEASKAFENESRELISRANSAVSAASVAEARARAAEATADEARAWRKRVESAEEEVATLLGASGATDSETVEGAAGGKFSVPSCATPLTYSSPLLASAWEMLPAFATALPQLAAVVGALRGVAHAAERRARLSAAEAQDLREELALARGEDITDAVLRRAASRDVADALREGKAQRDELRAAVTALTEHVRAANSRADELERDASKARSMAESACSASEIDRAAVEKARTAAAASAAKCANAEKETALAEARYREATAINDRALALLADRDATIARLQLRVGVAAQDLEASFSGVDTGAKATSGMTRRALPPPTRDYSEVTVPRYDYYERNTRGLAISRAAAAARQQVRNLAVQAKIARPAIVGVVASPKANESAEFDDSASTVTSTSSMVMPPPPKPPVSAKASNASLFTSPPTLIKNPPPKSRGDWPHLPAAATAVDAYDAWATQLEKQAAAGQLRSSDEANDAANGQGGDMCSISFDLGDTDAPAAGGGGSSAAAGASAPASPPPPPPPHEATRRNTVSPVVITELDHLVSTAAVFARRIVSGATDVSTSELARKSAPSQASPLPPPRAHDTVERGTDSSVTALDRSVQLARKQAARSAAASGRVRAAAEAKTTWK